MPASARSSGVHHQNMVNAPRCATSSRFVRSKVSDGLSSSSQRIRDVGATRARDGVLQGINLDTLTLLEDNDKHHRSHHRLAIPSSPGGGGAKPMRQRKKKKGDGKATADAQQQQQQHLPHGHVTNRISIPVLNQEAGEPIYAVKLQLSMWMEAFEQELKVYRSSAIASELLLQRMQDVTVDQPQPSIMGCATGFTVLTYFAPLLGKSEELVRGILDELAKVAYISPVRSTSISTSAAAYSRGTFFHSFFKVAGAFKYHLKRSQKFELMMDRGQRVLDRAVNVWQKSLSRKMLQRWCGLAKHHKFLRKKYQRVFSRANQKGVVSNCINLWKKHAHETQLEMLANVNDKAAEHVAAALQIQRQTQERMSILEAEVRNNEGRLKEISAVRGRLQRILANVTTHLDDATLMVREMRHEWATVVHFLFNDGHHVPPGGNYLRWMEDVIGPSFLEITGMGGMYKKRTTTRNAKLDGSCLMALMAKLAPNVTAEANKLQRKLKTRGVGGGMQHATAEQAEKALLMFRVLTQGQPAPITAKDIVRGDQLKILGFVNLLMSMFAGGYCGLFFPNSAPPPHPPPLHRQQQNNKGKQKKIMTRKKSDVSILLNARQLGEDDVLASSQDDDDDDGDNSLLATHATGSASTPFSGMGAMLESRASFDGGNNHGNAINNNSVELASVDVKSRLADVNVDVLHVDATEAVEMIHDWERGKEVMEPCESVFLHSNAAFAEAVQMGDTMQAHREAQHLFDMLMSVKSRNGIPRDLIESSIVSFVSQEDWNVISLLYPEEEDGITTITDLIQYASQIGEVTELQVLQVLRKMEDHLELSQTMQFMMMLREEDVQLELRSFDQELRRSFRNNAVDVNDISGEELSDLQGKTGAATNIPQALAAGGPAGRPGDPPSPMKGHISHQRTNKAGMRLTKSKKKLMVLSKEGYSSVLQMCRTTLGLQLTPDQKAELYNQVAVSSPSNMIDEEAFEVLMCALTVFHDPSPFAALHSRLRIFLSGMFRNVSSR